MSTRKTITPTAERLRELLDYNEETGAFRWKVSRGGKLKGSVAGCPHPDGGVYIGVDGIVYYAHHLAWTMKTGCWPTKEIDHRDVDRANNAWLNLREATPTQNQANRRVRADSETKLKGVYRYKACQLERPFEAYIRINGKRVHLGYHPTPEKAHAAYVAAAEKVFGEFARAS